MILTLLFYIRRIAYLILEFVYLKIFHIHMYAIFIKKRIITIMTM